MNPWYPFHCFSLPICISQIHKLVPHSNPKVSFPSLPLSLAHTQSGTHGYLCIFSVHKERRDSSSPAVHRQDNWLGWKAPRVPSTNQSRTHPLPESRLLPLQLRIDVHQLPRAPHAPKRRATAWPNLFPDATLQIPNTTFSPRLVRTCHQGSCCACSFRPRRLLIINENLKIVE